MLAVGVVGLGVLPGTGPPAHGQEEQEPEERDDGEGRGDVEVEVVGGLDGVVAPGRAYPVVVTVEAQRLVRGDLQLRVAAAGGPVELDRPIEVAGGNTERFWMLAPPAVDRLSLRAVVVEDGSRIASATAELRLDLAREQVGFLPDGWRGDDPTGVVELAVADLGSAAIGPLEPEMLDLGPLALEPLDQLVVLPEQLADLADGHRAVIGTWVQRGGQLLVVGEDPELLDGLLPDEWRPAPGDGARAGLGQVRLVGEDWTERLLPSPTRSVQEEEIVASDLTQPGSLAFTLSDRARLRLPSATGLVVLLVAYVLVLGPLTFLGARLVRRRQLTWVAVPALSVVFTGVVFGAESRVTTPRGSAQVTVYETGPGGAVATTWSLLTAHREGDVGLDLPSGWTAAPTADMAMLGFGVDPAFGGPAAMPFRVEAGADGRGGQAVGDPPTGGYGMVTASGPAPGMDEALVVTARSEADGRIVGTVRNQLDVPLEHVVALVGRVGAADIGTLGPGEERELEIADATLFAWGGPQPEYRLWPAEATDEMLGFPGGREVILPLPPPPAGADGDLGVEVIEPRPPPPIPVPTVADGPPAIVIEDLDAELAEVLVEAERSRAAEAAEAAEVEAMGGARADDEASASVVVPAAWATLLGQTGYGYRPAGQVVVVGWTDELPSPLETRSGTTDVAWSSSAVVARATAVPAAERLTDTASVRYLVRGPATERGVLAAADDDGGAGAVQESLIGMVFAFDLPQDVAGRPVDTTRLVINPAASWRQAAIWTTTAGWVPIEVPEQGQAELEVPPEAVVEGMVFLRGGISAEVPRPGRDLVIYEQEGAS